MEKNSFIDGTENTNDSLFEHYSFKVDLGQSSLRVDKFLMSRIENVSRNKIQEAAKAGNIFVSDKTVKSNYRIKRFTIQVFFNRLYSRWIILDFNFENSN